LKEKLVSHKNKEYEQMEYQASKPFYERLIEQSKEYNKKAREKEYAY
jgi:hypothetical protein